jgi:hypothetical protein
MFNLCTIQFAPQNFANHQSEEKVHVFSRIFYAILKRINVFLICDISLLNCKIEHRFTPHFGRKKISVSET